LQDTEKNIRKKRNGKGANPNLANPQNNQYIIKVLIIFEFLVF